MPAALRAAVALAAFTATQALVVRDAGGPWVRDGDHITDSSHPDALPGTPVVPAWADDPKTPVLTRQEFDAWRYELADRLLRVADAHDAMERCGSFVSFGDFVWCRRAMPEEADPAYTGKFGSVHRYVVDKNATPAQPPAADSLRALSFGVEESDCWSELMSSLYHLESDLFDCFYSGNKGPIANDWHGNHTASRPCDKRHCYTVEYRTHKICLDGTSNVEQGFKDRKGRKFERLSTMLEGRAPLSTFVKMDIEGSEWGVLERLFESDEDLAKIRTLDMELHFNMGPYAVQRNASSGVSVYAPDRFEKETLYRRVELMERLLTKFAATGSTLEHKLQAMVKGYGSRRLTLPGYAAPAAFILTGNGLNIDQYSISFVNRQLL